MRPQGLKWSFIASLPLVTVVVAGCSGGHNIPRQALCDALYRLCAPETVTPCPTPNCPTETPSGTATPTPAETQTPSPTPEPEPTNTPTRTRSRTRTPTPTPTMETARDYYLNGPMFEVK